MPSLMYSSLVVLLAFLCGWGGSLPAHANLTSRANPAQAEAASRHIAQILLGMSPEAIAAVDLDADQLWQGLAILAAEKEMTRAFKDNALQLQRALKELQELKEAGDQGAKSFELSLEIRSRQEGTRIMIQECRETVFGELAGSEGFRIIAGEVSPWESLPLPYRNHAVPASAAFEIMKLQTDHSAGDDAASRHRLDQLFAQLDLIEDVVLMRNRIRERLPRVLKALDSF